MAAVGAVGLSAEIRKPFCSKKNWGGGLVGVESVKNLLKEIINRKYFSEH
jgi:hypothetical protein